MKSDTELRGGIVSVLAQLALQAAVPYAIEYALGEAGNLENKYQEEKQRNYNYYIDKQNAYIERENRAVEGLLQREQDERDKKQMEIFQQTERATARNMEAEEQVRSDRQRVADEERMQKQEDNQRRYREQSERIATELIKSREATQMANEKTLSQKVGAIQQENAIRRSNLDKLTNNQLRDKEQRQRKMEEVQRLQQQAIAREVQQRVQIAAAPPPQRVVAKAKTKIATRRGFGVNQEVLQYLTETMKLPLKDAKKVLKTYF
jgi:hypothetical protein